MTSMIQDNVEKLEQIEQISYHCLKLIDMIWQHGIDKKFNDSIDQLIIAIDNYKNQSDQLLNNCLEIHRNKLNTYKTIFSIDIERDIRNGLIAQMMHSHVVDTWKITLLQINNDTIRVINDYLWSKRKSLGKYIECLQNTFSHKNRARHEQRAIISMLGRLIKSKDIEIMRLQEQLEPLEQDYEMVILKPFTTISQWFRT